jgi:hypothetical protein
MNHPMSSPSLGLCQNNNFSIPQQVYKHEAKHEKRLNRPASTSCKVKLTPVMGHSRYTADDLTTIGVL